MNRGVDSQPREGHVVSPVMKRQCFGISRADSGRSCRLTRSSAIAAALEFTYEWPAQAAAIPALDLKFYKDAKKALGEAQANAR